METNPYAAPKARVADPEPDFHGLFTIITLGLYYPVWWFRRRPGLNRLNSPRKLSIWPLLAMALVWAILIIFSMVEGAAPGAVAGTGADSVLSLFQLAVGIVMIFQSFRIKEMIEDHATPDAHSGPMFAERVQLSGVMTFFFSIFYLQWAINRYVVGTA
jgi:hypothetical protein